MDFEKSTIVKALLAKGAPRVEFKGFKEAGGEETCRYSAKLYFNGTFVAYCGNGGTGGPDECSWVRNDDSQQAVRDAQAFIKSIPPEPFEHEGKVDLLTVDEDLFLGTLVEYTTALKSVAGGKRTVFTLPEKPGMSYSIKGPLDAGMRAYVLKKHPTARFLNDLLGLAADAAKPVETAKPAITPRKGTVREIAEALLAQSAPVLSYEDVIAHVKATHPDAKTSVASLRWYESKMRAAGTAVPSRKG